MLKSLSPYHRFGAAVIAAGLVNMAVGLLLTWHLYALEASAQLVMILWASLQALFCTYIVGLTLMSHTSPKGSEPSASEPNSPSPLSQSGNQQSEKGGHTPPSFHSLFRQI